MKNSVLVLAASVFICAMGGMSASASNLLGLRCSRGA